MSRDDTNRARDESGPISFPTRTLVALLLGAAAYGAYRMVQTGLVSPDVPSHSLSSLDRILVSAADGCIMAALAPVALWMSRSFPIGPPIRLRNIAIHGVVAVVAAAGWILALLGVFAAVTGTPLPTSLASVSLEWVTSNIFAYALFVAVLHALSFQQRLRDRELHAVRLEARLTAARLETLRAQLHPHFLFNTLHTISELIHIDPPAADAMVIRLGRLLRMSLDFTADAEIPLDRELDVLSTYLEVQRVRYGDRIDVHVDADPTVLASLVPPMILQSLVENALRHGVAPRSSPGTVWVTACVSGQMLRLTVEDDGVGLAPAMREGVGLSNTRTRLAALYGDDQRFYIGPRAGGGVAAVIDLPLRFTYRQVSHSHSEPGRRQTGSAAPP